MYRDEVRKIVSKSNYFTSRYDKYIEASSTTMNSRKKKKKRHYANDISYWLYEFEKQVGKETAHELLKYVGDTTITKW